MIVGIHQPNYFPWMGYFDKMDKSDIFILLDEVQLTDSSMTQRNRVLNCNGVPAYITVAFQKAGYMQKQLREIALNQEIDWQKRQMDFLKGTYGKTPYFKEVWEFIEPIFSKHYNTLVEVNYDTICLIKDMLEISTKIVWQSQLDYPRDAHKNDLILNLCKSVSANLYLSGTGAQKYMDLDSFDQSGIKVEFQNFTMPEYEQKYAKEFCPGLSMLDVMLNCGIEGTKKLFQKRNSEK
ncbi:MAG: WbqC family protein [Suilimivivens sp.]